MPITKKDERWIKFAQKILKYSTHPKYHIGAVLVKSGSLIELGVNRQCKVKDYIKPDRENFNLHAEINCLDYVARKAAKHGTIYTVGVTAVGNPINSKPCKTCFAHIKKMGIKRIVYKDKDKIQELKL